MRLSILVVEGVKRLGPVSLAIAFFFTGLHYDYHRVTDEPQYIHYPKLARIADLVRDVAVELANRAERPVMNPTTP